MCTYETPALICLSSLQHSIRALETNCEFKKEKKSTLGANQIRTDFQFRIEVLRYCGIKCNFVASDGNQPLDRIFPPAAYVVLLTKSGQLLLSHTMYIPLHQSETEIENLFRNSLAYIYISFILVLTQLKNGWPISAHCVHCNRRLWI